MKKTSVKLFGTRARAVPRLASLTILLLLGHSSSGLASDADCLSSIPQVRIPGCTQLLAKPDLAPDVRNSHLSRRAYAYIEIRNFTAADADISEMLRINSSRNFLAFAVRGRLRQMQGRYDLALEDYNHGYAIATDKLYPLAARGNFFVRTQQLDKAEADLKEAYRLNPNHSVTLQGLSALARARGDDKAAIEYLGKLLSVAPKFASAYSDRGELYYKNNELQKALADFEKALGLHGGDERARMGRDAVLAALAGQKPPPPKSPPQQDAPPPQPTQQSLPTGTGGAGPAPPAQPEGRPVRTAENKALFEKATAAQKAGRCAEAMPLFEEIIKGQPNDFEAKLLRAFCLAPVGRGPEADAVYLEILRSAAPADIRSNAANNLGVSHRNALNFKDALGLFVEATKLDPRSAVAQGNVAAALYDLGRYSDATKAAEAGLTLDPNNGWVRGWLAMALVAQGNAERSEQLIAESLGREPRNALVLTARAMLRLKQKSIESAEQDARLARQISPSSREAALALDLIYLHRNLAGRL